MYFSLFLSKKRDEGNNALANYKTIDQELRSLGVKKLLKGHMALRKPWIREL